MSADSGGRRVRASASAVEGAGIGMVVGADVIQGHCVVRNGRAGWLSRMVAVDFESI